MRVKNNNKLVEGSCQCAKVGVGVIIEKDGKILLMKRAGLNGRGTWSGPGGHIDYGETLEETARRETKEEVGVNITNVRFMVVTNDVMVRSKRHYITIWMRGDYASGKPRINSRGEVTEVGWFEWKKLPKPLFKPYENLLRGDYYPIGVDIFS